MATVSFLVRINVEVHDEKALYRAAMESFLRDGLCETQAKEMIGESESAANVDECLIAVFDPGTSPDGTSIVETTVERMEVKAD